MTRQLGRGTVALCAALLLAGVLAGSAQANRPLVQRMTEFNGPHAVTVDGDDNVWATDGGQSSNTNPGVEGLYKYDPIPSETLLSVPNSYESFSHFSFALQPAVDDETGEVFVAQSNGRQVFIFSPISPEHQCKEEFGETYCYTNDWIHINGANSSNPNVHVAIDNTHSFSRGRVYLSLQEPENDVEALDNQERPVEFPATAPYITDNKLTGTPSGRFGSVEWITVDTQGNVYVTDIGKNEIDEFEPSGLFVRKFPGSGAVAVDPTNGNVLIPQGGYNEETEEGGVREFDSSGNFLQAVFTKTFQNQPGGQPATNSQGYLYVPAGSAVAVFGPRSALAEVTYKPVGNPTPVSGTLNATVDPNGAGAVTECKFEYGTSTGYGTALPCLPPGSISTPTDVSLPIASLTTGTTYHYRVVARDANGVKYGADQTYTPHGVLGLRTTAATAIGEAGATLNAAFVGNGEATQYHFEWGQTTAYGNSTPAGSASPGAGTTETPSATVTGLAPYTTYHFRVVASNGSGPSIGEDMTFTTTPGVPSAGSETVTLVHSDRVLLHGVVNPNGADTQAVFEYVPDEEFQVSGFANAQKTEPGLGIGMGKRPKAVAIQVTGLEQQTLYHYRIVGVNEAGPGVSAEPHTFRTFPFAREINDRCPNAHVRQQTGTALLLDCRAYELVSAANAGGYDVESSLVEGQAPFSNYPEAADSSGDPRVLYGIHDGGLPGFLEATNRGIDPYVATRTANGWSTAYKGIPANASPSAVPFSSTLLEADSSLSTLAFGGPEICSPCFSDGSSGDPVRLPNGELAQGMTGSTPDKTAKPAGFVGRHLSSDGTHFVFGSKAKLEPDGNNNGDATIYDRNLATKVTHVVSKTPGGTTMTGPGIGELDISGDGSHILVGQLVSESGSARYWHLYMNVGDSSKTVDLTPGASDGVLFAGMSEDGTKVFYTTDDHITGATPADTDTSADLYEAEVAGDGSVTLTRLSAGTGSGDTDSCSPYGNTVDQHWNALAAEEDCSVVAVGGGGGVARGDGTIFFLSPEKLDGSDGVQNAPNLYVVRPGAGLKFVATLESTGNAPLPLPTHKKIRNFGAFQNPAAVGFDDPTGDVYVLDIGNTIGQGFIFKFTPDGKPILSFGKNGKLIVSGMDGFNNIPTQIAVDSDPTSPNYRDFFIPEIDSEGGHFNIKQFSASGELVGSFETFDPSAVAVDAATGNIFVSVYQFSAVVEYNPQGLQTGLFFTSEHSPNPTAIAVGAGGQIYVANGGGPSAAKGTTEVYDAAGNWIKQLTGNPSKGVTVDPTDNHVFVDEGNQISEFDPAGNSVGDPSGGGILKGSISLDASGGMLVAGNPSEGNVDTFAQAALPDDPRVDSRLVIDSLNEPGIRNTRDFQVNPSGDDAAFISALPLTGYDNDVTHREVFRYDSADGLDCPSCNPTGEKAVGQASLPANGQAISDDGRVFFNTTEGLVDRDLNELEDAYQWEPSGFDFGSGQPACALPGGCVQLISTGTSQFASNMLGISSSGTDAYFFTREKLAEEDQNGNAVKLYDARSLGGFPFVPPPAQCKASDECHGAGTPIPPPPNIKSVAPSPGGNSNSTKKTACKRGQVRKNGRCVARKHHKAHHRKGHKGGTHHG